MKLFWWRHRAPSTSEADARRTEELTSEVNRTGDLIRQHVKLAQQAAREEMERLA